MKQIHPQISRLLLAGLVACVLAGLSACSPSLAKLDPELFPPPEPNAITFWGHSTFYIDVDGFGLVIDPVFNQSLYIMRYRKIPAPPPGSYKNTGVILVSHAHIDHLSSNTIKTFPPEAVVLCPEPAAEKLSEVYQKVVTMKLGDEYPIPGGRVVAVPAHHPGGRYSLDAEPDGRALGYVIYTPYSTIYYTGDTDYFLGMTDIGLVHQPDISIINVSGHLLSTDAVRAAWATRSPVVIPSHYGAYGYFWLFPEFKKPRTYEVVEKLLGPILHTLELGGSLPIDGTR
jgi:L-ascorbate metabolism protein UlaG (beta-lactamase superfamily)